MIIENKYQEQSIFTESAPIPICRDNNTAEHSGQSSADSFGQSPELSTRQHTTQFAQGDPPFGYSQCLIREHMLTLRVDGIPRAQILCTPRDLPELAIGHLFCEERLTPRQIRRITITEDGDAAAETDSLRTEASDDTAAAPRENTAVRDAATVPCEKAAICAATISPAHWEPAWIFALADRLAGGMPLHAATHSAHCCFLAKGDRILFAAEDISRHCAADKAIGYMLLQDIPPEECILYTSGRIPSDLVQKALRAGIPVLAGKAAPTAEAVKLAADQGLTLIGNARPDRMVLFHDGSIGMPR